MRAKKVRAAPVAAPRPALIFLHIPKAAGSTLTLVLSRQYPAEATFLTGGPRRPGLEQLEALPMHERARFDCLAGHMRFGVHRLLPGPSRYITMVRDPVARVVSAYYYIRGFPEHPMHERIMRDWPSLEQYACLGPSDEQVRILSGDPGGPATRAMLEQARRNIEEHFVAVGLTERFEEFMVLSTRLLGWRDVYYAPRNVTPVRPRHDTLPPSVIATIEEHNRLDRELYRFATQAFERALREQGIGRIEVLRFKIRNRLHRVMTAAAQRASVMGSRGGGALS
jgi:hypothetical protein